MECCESVFFFFPSAFCLHCTVGVWGWHSDPVHLQFQSRHVVLKTCFQFYVCTYIFRYLFFLSFSSVPITVFPHLNLPCLITCWLDLWEYLSCAGQKHYRRCKKFWGQPTSSSGCAWFSVGILCICLTVWNNTLQNRSCFDCHFCRQEIVFVSWSKSMSFSRLQELRRGVFTKTKPRFL